MRGQPAALLATAVAIAVATGCSVVKAPERPAWQVYALEPDAPPAQPSRASSSAGDGGVLVIAVPESAPGYATSRMVYTLGSGELRHFAEHRWADTPARMLVPHLQEALAATGAFGAVVTMPTRARGDHVVESEVVVFRQELDGDAARFRASVRITLLGAAGAKGRVESRTFGGEEPVSSPGPGPGVAAANRLTARLLDEAARFCVEAVARGSAKSDQGEGPG